MKALLCLILPFIFCGVEAAKNCCNCSCKSGCCKSSRVRAQKKDSKKNIKRDQLSVKDLIKQEYGKVAECSSCCVTGAGCCGGGSDLSRYLGYSKEELAAIPEANLGLGCGHPVSLGEIKDGDIVLDLGSGAGIDCFIAAKKVGSKGKVIGIDMTDSMIRKARENAKKYGFENVEFRLGDIENLPVQSDSVNVIISNCVINLAEDKFKVFQEAFRVLKPGGKMYVSDVILIDKLSQEQKMDAGLICACVGGALLKEDYISKLQKAGFRVEIIDVDKGISKKWFGNDDLPIASLKFIAHKVGV